MSSLKLLLEAALIANIAITGYPKETTNLSNSITNASNVFKTEINIPKNDNLSNVNFKNIFGTNPTDETADPVIVEEKKDFTYTVIPLDNDFASILKIGERGILIGAGKKENKAKILQYLGKNNLQYLDAIIMLGADDEESNIYEFAEMKLTTKVILVNPDLEKNSDNFNIMNKLSSMKTKLKEMGINVENLNDKTKIDFVTATITGYLEKGKKTATLTIKVGEQKILIQNDMSKEKLKDILNVEYDVLVAEEEKDIDKDIFEKGKPRKLVIYSKDRLEPRNKGNKEKGDKYLKPEDIIEVNNDTYAKMDMKRTEVILSVSKVTVLDAEKQNNQNTRVIDNNNNGNGNNPNTTPNANTNNNSPKPNETNNGDNPSNKPNNERRTNNN